MITLRWIVVGLLALSTAPGYAQQQTLPTFFEKLFHENATKYKSTMAGTFEKFCREQKVDSSDTTNDTLYHKLWFMHDLLKCNSATDCAMGGMLRIPYFWHWITPNPRHEILALPDSVKLSSIKPPAEFNLYKTFADIDRPPSLFLKDLVTDEPSYYHSLCGEFCTFGWCGEREVSFALLLSLQGYSCKIVQSNNHVWTEVWINFHQPGGGTVPVVFKVDNTFDSFSTCKPVTAKLEWQKDYGNHRDAKRYNRIASSNTQVGAVKNISVSQKAQERIRELVLNALK